jgi:lipid-binding SYLF domain-containing protein
MTSLTRRKLLLAMGGTAAACTTSPAIPARVAIDQSVQEALAELYDTVPGAAQLASRAHGILVIPEIREVGLFASGAYGEGALLIGQTIVDYYSLSALSAGLTFGAQEYNQALFFLTPEALRDFRVSDGWELGLDAAVVVLEDGAAASIDTTRINRPIYEVIYGQRGLLAGASLAGAKYSRIIR